MEGESQQSCPLSVTCHNMALTSQMHFFFFYRKSIQRGKANELPEECGPQPLPSVCILPHHPTPDLEFSFLNMYQVPCGPVGVPTLGYMELSEHQSEEICL